MFRNKSVTRKVISLIAAGAAALALTPMAFAGNCGAKATQVAKTKDIHEVEVAYNQTRQEAPTAVSLDIVDTAVQAGAFNTLATALTEANLIDVLKEGGPFTVFAPTDEAFAKIPPETLQEILADEEQLRSILLYHVVSGTFSANQVVELSEVTTVQGSNAKISIRDGAAFIDDARITQTDVMATNGVIHVIDSVILPGATEEKPRTTVVDAAVSNENFTTLVAAVQAAGLVDTLSGEGPFTVFAPTNAAFEKLPEGTVESLLENPAQLRNVLLFHVIQGNVLAEDVVELDEATTALGQKVKIRVDEGKVFINDSQVVTTDIVTDNGVIHVIDTVLIPS